MSDSDAKNVTLSVKAMINKERTKVLFFEADRDFADVLLSFLTLPLGKILKLLESRYGDDAPVIGSIFSLYKSLANLEDKHFATKAAKQMLLNPRASSAAACRNLKLDLTDPQPIKYLLCNTCCEFGCVYEPTSCDCGGMMDTLLHTEDPIANSPDGCAFLAMNEASFFISDDLRITTSSTGFLQTLKCFGIEDLNGAELMDVTLGIEEVIGLLKFSLISETPLTDFILNKAKKHSSAARLHETMLLLNPVEENDSKTICLRVTMQKSSDKLLFAQSEDDFADLLFSFFTFPLGLIESLLDNNTCLKNIDNVYKSLAEAIEDKYFTSPTTKNRLMKPDLPYGYTSEDQFLPLSEDDAPNSFEYTSWKSPKGLGNYVKKPRTFMISDDLRVTNFHMTSGVTFLTNHNIPLSDVYELELKIGPKEALNILKASLTSTSALNDGLKIDHKFKKQPKHEPE